MPPPAFLTGVLSGFTKAASESRRLAREDQAAQDKRELDTLDWMTKSDNQKISHPAIQAILDITAGVKRPKGGYLAQLMGPGEPTIHPAVGSLLRLIQGGERTEIPAPTLGSMHVGPTPSQAGTIPTPPPTAGAAAMPPPPNKPGGGITPPTSAGPVQVGAPPEIIPVSNTPDLRAPTGGPPLQFGSTGQAAGPPTVVRTPMHIFDTPEEKAIKLARAKAQGDTEGDIAGWMSMGKTREEALKLVEAERMRSRASSAGTMLQVPGTLNGESAFAIHDRRPSSPTFGRFLDPDTLTPIEGFEPAVTTGSARSPLDDIAMMQQFGGKKYALLTPEQRTVVDAEARRRVGDTAFRRTMGTAQANAIRPFSVQEVFSNEGDLRSRLFQYTQHAQQTVQMGSVINEAKRQIDTGLIEGAPIGAQSEALISAFKRITDELSAVRNEEYNRSAENQSFYNRIDGWWTKVMQGGAGLAKAEIDNVVQMANAIVETRRHYIQDQATATYQAGASRGFNPANFLTPDQMEMLGVRGRAPGGPPPSGPGQPMPGTEGPPALGIGSFVGAGDPLPPRTVVKRTTDPATGETILLATVGAKTGEVQYAGGKYYWK